MRTDQITSFAVRTLVLTGICFTLNACVTQVVTTPAQVATQTTQTAAQTAGQAAQAVTPGGGDELTSKGFTGNSQSSAYGFNTKKPERSNRQ